MTPKTLYLMCGPAGSGKTTFVSKYILASEECCHHVSRDNIRFGLLKEGDNYFAYEDKVYELFIEDIQETLKSDIYDTVFADATHLTAKARAKTLNDIFKDERIEKNNVFIVPVFVDVPLETCLERNARRHGRRLVPETVVTNMCKSKQFPQFNENDYVYDHVMRIDEYGNEMYFYNDKD